jgi:hypothetical protein
MHAMFRLPFKGAKLEEEMTDIHEQQLSIYGMKIVTIKLR